MASEETVQKLAGFLQVSESTVYTWIRAGKINATKYGRNYNIDWGENREFLAAQLRIKHSKPLSAWIPKEIGDYSEWHELLDEFSWLIKICYSSKDDIKRKRFRLDRLFANYLTAHKIDLGKVRQIFASNANPNFRLITNDLKRGWYNELSYVVPLKKSTLGLSFDDIEHNKEDSSIRFAFPSWRITSAYYSTYFYLRGITLQKQDGFRLQEHSSTISSFKSNLLQPLARVLWKFPLELV